MSGGGASRASIPAGARGTVQNIKEIAGNHSEEEIYAMLKECAMDPNETTQKLLVQDTFHEVKSKRNKRKENVREHVEPKWRARMQGRGGRGGRGNYSSSSITNDAAPGRNVSSGRDRGANEVADRGNASSLSIRHESDIAISPSNIDYPISSKRSNVSGVNGSALSKGSSGDLNTSTGNPRSCSNKLKSGSASRFLAPDSGQSSSNKTVEPVAIASDHSLWPSFDAHSAAELETTKQVPIKAQVSRTNELPEKSKIGNSSMSSSYTGSRPPSTYTNRSQHLSGLQKAPPRSKEWKPKTIYVNPAQASETAVTSNVPVVAEYLSPLPQSSCSVSSGEETTPKLEKLKLSDRQVIIPDHLQVPDSVRLCLSFGSFDANFELNIVKVPARNKIGAPLSKSSQETEEIIDEPSLRSDTASSPLQESDLPDHPQSSQVPDNYSNEEPHTSSSISSTTEYDQSKEEPALAQENPEPPVALSAPSRTSPEVVPQVHGNQLASIASLESLSPDTSRLPSFLVQQAYEPSSNYHTQFYRPADADGRISPFLPPGASSRYNGNITVLPAQTGQASHESTYSTMISPAGSTPAMQASGAVQSSLTIPQQPIPLFRQPAGLQLSHYPPNYIQYSQYFSPFYIPPSLHFLSGAAFPQSPATGSIYPTGTGTTASAKYSLSPYRPAPNVANPMIVGMPTGYGNYNSTLAGYTPAPAASGGNSTNENSGPSQFKENNVYIAGQQSEGSALWIPVPGQEISAIQPSSFYNVSSQAQQMTFTPTQGSHGGSRGIYPPGPTVFAPVSSLRQQSQTAAGAIEMVAPSAGVYQSPQHSQINRTTNY